MGSLAERINSLPSKGSDTFFLTHEEEIHLSRRWLDHRDIEARNKILMAYRPLCIGMARKMAPRHMFREDIVQEAMIGLMTAVEKFDPSLGFRFGTYARWWVRARLSGVLGTTESGRVGLTGESMRMRKKYDLARREALRTFEKQGLDPGSQEVRDEIARILMVDPVEVDLFEASRSYSSLDASTSEDDNGAGGIIDTIASDDPDSETKIDLSRQESLHADVLEDLCKVLKPREREVLDRRFGLKGKPETLKAIATDLGLTNERIRQIETIALNKIRSSKKSTDWMKSMKENLFIQDRA